MRWVGPAMSDIPPEISDINDLINREDDAKSEAASTKSGKSGKSRAVRSQAPKTEITQVKIKCCKTCLHSLSLSSCSARDPLIDLLMQCTLYYQRVCLTFMYFVLRPLLILNYRY